MTERKLNEKDGAALCCPRCMNLTNVLMVHADFIDEEVSEAWVQCECGFKPKVTSPPLDISDTLDTEKVGMAIRAWNDAVGQ